MPHNHMKRNKMVWAYILIVVVAFFAFAIQQRRTQANLDRNGKYACEAIAELRSQFNALLPARRQSLLIDAKFLNAAAQARDQTATQEPPRLAAIDRRAAYTYRQLAGEKLTLIATLAPVPPVRCDDGHA